MKQLLLYKDDEGNIEYPLDLREKFPFTSFPDVLKPNNMPEGVHIVLPTDKPTIPPHSHNLIVDEVSPLYDSGWWFQQWTIREYNDEEIAEIAKEKKEQRNRLLEKTDWTQLKDIPIEVQNKYTTYRQKLRDITDDPMFPFNEFPEID